MQYTPTLQMEGSQRVRTSRNPDLARTYRMIAEGGPRRLLRRPHRKDDRSLLQTHRWLALTRISTRPSRRVGRSTRDTIACRRLCDGRKHARAATLQMLNIIEQFDVKQMGFHRSLYPYSDRSKTSGLRRSSTLLRRSPLLEDPRRMAQLKRLRQERAKLIKMDRILQPIYPARRQARRHHLLPPRR